jgi:hypothetical protein
MPTEAQFTNTQLRSLEEFFRSKSNPSKPFGSSYRDYVSPDPEFPPDGDEMDYDGIGKFLLRLYTQEPLEDYLYAMALNNNQVFYGIGSGDRVLYSPAIPAGQYKIGATADLFFRNGGETTYYSMKLVTQDEADEYLAETSDSKFQAFFRNVGNAITDFISENFSSVVANALRGRVNNRLGVWIPVDQLTYDNRQLPPDQRVSDSPIAGRFDDVDAGTSTPTGKALEGQKFNILPFIGGAIGFGVGGPIGAPVGFIIGNALSKQPTVKVEEDPVVVDFTTRQREEIVRQLQGD